MTNITESETEPQPLNEFLQILNDDKKLTIYATDENMQPYLFHIHTEILNRKNLPLIIGYRNLFEAKSTIELGNHNLTIGWKTEKLCLPVNL